MSLLNLDITFSLFRQKKKFPKTGSLLSSPIVERLDLSSMMEEGENGSCEQVQGRPSADSWEAVGQRSHLTTH